jgi:hypothetical protein
LAGFISNEVTTAIEYRLHDVLDTPSAYVQGLAVVMLLLKKYMET